jgi:pimeloyl-ACP methyl ester carboxylesterase
MKPFFASYYGDEHDFSDCRFILFGTSAGAISALALASIIPDAQIAYIGLADAAFYDNDSSFLMKTPLSRGYFANENYYQTADRLPWNNEIHGTVAGFNNRNLTASLSWSARNTGHGAHDEAVNKSVAPASATIKRCIDSDRSS